MLVAVATVEDDPLHTQPCINAASRNQEWYLTRDDGAVTRSQHIPIVLQDTDLPIILLSVYIYSTVLEAAYVDARLA